MTIRRFRQLVLLLVAAALIGLAVARVRGQGESLDDRVRNTEDRLARIEQQLDDLEGLCKAVVTVVGGQLVLTGLDLKWRRRGR